MESDKKYGFQHKSKIYLLRHGETLWNTEGRLQGQKDSALTVKGQQQAHDNGIQLSKLIGHQPRFVSSPLERCRQTSKIIASAIDFDFSKVEYDDRVMETSFGRWEGQTKGDIKVNDAELFALRNANLWDVPAPDGESYSMAETRLQAWLNDMDGQEIILVTHGCAGRILRCIYSELPKDKVHSLDVSHDAIYMLENETITRVV